MDSPLNSPKPKETPSLLPPRRGADALQVVSETHSQCHWYEDVDAPHKKHKPKEIPSFTPPHKGADALQVVTEPHLYEDVDGPQKNPKPRDTGLRQFIKNKALGTDNKNNLPKDEPPSLTPPHKGAEALPAVTEPHLYEDVDSPLNSPKPKDTGLRQFIKNKALGTANKNNLPKDEPPPQHWDPLEIQNL
ncbi:Hypp2373 [Branchiostoma lanceolatum]|uniref:Hypp2373 protein n=1 Tax=Branchiostoma lanceolatum TaxID=7740 RepID=A0A8K0EMG6_BRALA|nr:Hypp2373 [Branchiostoma lanceolatum]